MIKSIIEKIVDYNVGVYISVKITPESKILFDKYVKQYLGDFEPNPEPHLTLIYSKKSFKGIIKNKPYTVSCKFKKFSIFGKTEMALVAELSSDELVKRNSELVKQYGFVSDFDEYKPHLTLVYDIPEDFEIESLPEIDFELSFNNETIEQLDMEWNK